MNFFSKCRKSFMSLELFPSCEAHALPQITIPRAGMKHIYLIRHGQSEYNKQLREAMMRLDFKTIKAKNEFIRDAPLSDIGIQQSNNLGKVTIDDYTEKTIDRVYVSPLTRALQTAVLGLPGYSQPVIATHLLAEIRHSNSDLARPIEDVTKLFPKVDFDNVDLNAPLYTYSGNPFEQENEEDLKSRTSEFTKMLLTNSDLKNVVVVGHSLFFKAMTGSEKMMNCEVFKYELSADGKWTQIFPAPE